jgi:hypothetical protein
MKLLKPFSIETEGKIIDFGLSNFTPSQSELIRQKLEVDSSNSVFSNTFGTNVGWKFELYAASQHPTDELESAELFFKRTLNKPEED